jgi:hypothetical protein
MERVGQAFVRYRFGGFALSISIGDSFGTIARADSLTTRILLSSSVLRAGLATSPLWEGRLRRPAIVVRRVALVKMMRRRSVFHMLIDASVGQSDARKAEAASSLPTRMGPLAAHTAVYLAGASPAAGADCATKFSPTIRAAEVPCIQHSNRPE